jgi:arsenate reductase
MSQITIYHNPACGTSRNALALIRHSGEEPEIIEYLPSPPSRETLQALIRAMGMPVRELLRRKGTPFDELGLGDPADAKGRRVASACSAAHSAHRCSRIA